MIRTLSRQLWRRPTIWALFVSLALFGLTDLVKQGLSPEPYVHVGPHDGEGPFEPVRDAGGRWAAGAPIAVLHPGQPWAMVGDIVLTPGAAERAVIEFVCDGRVLLTVPKLFRPGERPVGIAVGVVPTPADASGDCEVTRTLTVVPWHGIAIGKRLRSVFVKVQQP